MKSNSGIFFHILFGVINLTLGIYCLKILIFLSFIFFIATVVNIVLLYREFDIRDRLTTNLASLPIQDELQVNNSRSISAVTVLSYLVFISVSVFFLNLVLKNQPENFLAITMPLAAIAFSLIMIFLEIIKLNSTAFRINKKGIQIHNKPLMNWGDIENEKIILRTFTAKESKHHFKSEVNYLFFYFKGERIETAIDDLDITDVELMQYLKLYREYFNKGLQNCV